MKGTPARFTDSTAAVASSLFLVEAAMGLGSTNFVRPDHLPAFL